MPVIVFWSLIVVSGIYLIGLVLFGGVLLACRVGNYLSWSEVAELLKWSLSWPYWVPMAILYLRGHGFMKDA